jgi:hypothetical protein
VLAALAAVVLAGGMLTFPEGGYRALLAFTGLALLAWPAGAALAGMRVGGFVLGLVGGLVLAAGCAAAALALPKGVYLAYAGLWALAALLVVLRGRGLRVGGAVVLALLVGLALATVLISAFWSEPTRFMGSLGGALLVIAVLARQASAARPVAAAPAGSAGPADRAGGRRHGGHHPRRLLHGRPAFQHRLRRRHRFQHTTRSLGLVDGPLDALVGLGLGRYPEAYFWKVADPATPGSLALINDANGRAMRLAGPRQGVASTRWCCSPSVCRWIPSRRCTCASRPAARWIPR